MDAACWKKVLTLGIVAATIVCAQPQQPAVSLLARKCLACHNDKTSSSGLSLESRAAVLTGGARGGAVVPGQPQNSLMVAAIRQSGSLKMPPTGKLSDAEIELIQKWIADGAPGLAVSAAKTVS